MYASSSILAIHSKRVELRDAEAKLLGTYESTRAEAAHHALNNCRYIVINFVEHKV